jgi:glycosyltransferase involved in cell wall biosynthesis
VDVVPVEHVGRGSLVVPRLPAGILRRADLVVLHGGWMLNNVVVGRACARAGVPYVVAPHGVYSPEILARRPALKRGWNWAIERGHLRRALAAHVFFPEEVGYLDRLGVDIPALVVPNGVTYPEEVTWDGGSGGYLLWLGRFDPSHKGLDLLIRAIAALPPTERPEVRLHGPDWRGHRDAMRALARELSVESWVRVGDPVYGSGKWDLLRRSAGFVYPSRWDACPVSPAEAAAVGVPILVTRYPLGSFLAANGAAIQADARPDSIAAAITRIRSSAGAEVGRTALRVARRELSWDAVAGSWLRQLEEVPAFAHPAAPQVGDA